MYLKGTEVELLKSLQVFCRAAQAEVNAEEMRDLGLVRVHVRQSRVNLGIGRCYFSTYGINGN